MTQLMRQVGNQYPHLRHHGIGCLNYVRSTENSAASGEGTWQLPASYAHWVAPANQPLKSLATPSWVSKICLANPGMGALQGCGTAKGAVIAHVTTSVAGVLQMAPHICHDGIGFSNLGHITKTCTAKGRRTPHLPASKAPTDPSTPKERSYPRLESLGSFWQTQAHCKAVALPRALYQGMSQLMWQVYFRWHRTYAMMGLVFQNLEHITKCCIAQGRRTRQLPASKAPTDRSTPEEHSYPRLGVWDISG